ncbi:hypothetical protein MMC13_000523 [Lambiella insularis]|nr:hypothetical protein [Lambiella insularis]
MPFTFTAAPSSRITKPSAKKISLKRAASTPFPRLHQRAPVQRSQSKPEVIEDEQDDLFETRLDDIGLVTTLATDLSLRDVVQTMKYIRSHMFESIPERSGMSSTRTAEVLNFRRSLPPIVPNVHVHALIKSPTLVEREIAELTSAGVLRKIVVPGRGVGRYSISDALVLTEDWEQQFREAQDLETDLSEKYIDQLKASSLSPNTQRGAFTANETSLLMRAGYLSVPSRSFNSANVFVTPSDGSLGTLTSIASISRAASGSLAAVGGQGAVHQAGGGGFGGLRITKPWGQNIATEPSQAFLKSAKDFQLALPSTGSFLKLLTEARAHMMTLLSKLKYKEAPLYLLRERWDGGTEHTDSARKPNKLGRGCTEVLPGRTRKWKQFYGLRFNWILEECVGAGLVEVFETGSVGRGVRLL